LRSLWTAIATDNFIPNFILGFENCTIVTSFWQFVTRRMNERLQQLDVPRGGGRAHGIDDPDGAEEEQTWKWPSAFEARRHKTRHTIAMRGSRGFY
jgi:hypothetical protein